MVDTNLRARLLAMRDEDLRVRNELVESGELFDGYHPRMAAVHERHAAALGEIVDRHGWPGRSRVGDDGATAAWLLLQHSIMTPTLMRRCLPLLEQAAAAGEVEPGQPAHLADRIAVLEGRPQRYGTSFDWDDDGVLAPCPLEDSNRVDQWRAEVGLGPLADRIAQVRATARAEGDRPPADPSARRRAAETWAVEAGWRSATHEDG